MPPGNEGTQRRGRPSAWLRTTTRGQRGDLHKGVDVGGEFLRSNLERSLHPLFPSVTRSGRQCLRPQLRSPARTGGLSGASLLGLSSRGKRFPRPRSARLRADRTSRTRPSLAARGSSRSHPSPASLIIARRATWPENRQRASPRGQPSRRRAPRPAGRRAIPSRRPHRRVLSSTSWPGPLLGR